jgi:RNA polymerase sigma factor (sigma-70 family)
VIPGPFRPLSESQLDGLSDDEMIDYMLQGRAAGEHDAVIVALRVLVFGHYGNVERRVRIKVPPEAVDEVTGDAFVRALKAAFDGESIGQFVSWLNTITRAAIADYYRRGAPKELGGVGRPDPLPEAGTDRESNDGRRRAGHEPSTSGEYEGLEYQVMVDGILGRMQPNHKRAVELYLFEGYTGAEAGRKVGDELGEPLTEANVHQIASRFKKDLRSELGAGP